MKNKPAVTWTFENLIETCVSAGWLPSITTLDFELLTGGLAHLVRLMRDNVHPGKIARERPWWEAEERDYQDAKDIYVTLLSQVIKKKTPRNKAMV
jgi:hypothetical protein